MSRLTKINGIPVVDAKKALAIDVLPRDVTEGNTKDPGACAVALACIRKGYTEARVHLSRTYLRVGNKWLKFQTPQSIRTELISFDRGADFQSGTYTLKPLSPAQQTGRAHTPTKQKHGRPGHERTNHVVRGVRAHGANK